MLRTLVITAATIGLSAALLTAPATAGHKPNHNPGGGGGGGGGGDATFAVTLTDDSSAVEIAAGDGVESRGGSIDGLTEIGSFEDIALGSISTGGGTSDVQTDYNGLCSGVVNTVGALEAIDDIRVVPNPEINDVTVVVEYSVGTQSFTLLLQGPLAGDFPPAVTTDYGLTMWNNRGGGKGKKNRCGSGTQGLDGVTLEIVPTSP